MNDEAELLPGTRLRQRYGATSTGRPPSYKPTERQGNSAGPGSEY